MNSSFSNAFADATAKAVTAVQKAQVAGITAGFGLAGELLEQQRVVTLALLDAFTTAASTPRKG